VLSLVVFAAPGTGKTLLAKAVATECGTTFFNVSTSTLASKWRGESERMVRLLFEMARHYAPSVIFFDEMDSIAASRTARDENEASRRVKTEMLVQMDGISSLTAPKSGDDEGAADGEEAAPPAMKQVVVLAASNLPWELDEAFRRRFEKRIYIPLPNLEDREKMFEISLKDIALMEDVDLHKLAEASEGYSGADISNVCRDAAMVPMRKMMALMRGRGLRNVEEMKKAFAEESGSLQDRVSLTDFLESLARVSSSVGGSDLKRYQSWMEEFGAS
jgi:katanin p60 ATPase-containing subunit A1